MKQSTEKSGTELVVLQIKLFAVQYPKYLLLLFVFSALLACNPHKKTLEQASNLRNAGLHNEAYDRYLSVYREDPGNPDALIGLKESATALSNRYFAEVQMLHGQGKHQQGLNKLDEAESFVRSVAWLDVKPPFFAEELRPAIFNALADDFYAQAEAAVRDERWNQATELLKQSRRYNKDKPEITYLDRMIRILPDFRKGEKAFELGLYQEAYSFYDKVASIDADFNGVLQRMNECVLRARMTSTVMHTAPDSTMAPLQRAMTAAVKRSILDGGSPFVRLVTRDDLEYLLLEQRNGMTGAFNESSVIQAGQLIGADYVILGELLSYALVDDPVIELGRKGFAGRNILMQRVIYYEKEARRSLEASYRYYLMKTETGEVLSAENLTFQADSTVRWAEYNGDHLSLHPGNWAHQTAPSLQDKVHHDFKPNLDALLRAPRELPSERELEQRFVEYIGEEVARRVIAYAQERRIGL